MLDRAYTARDLESMEGDYELDEGRLVPVTRPMPRHGNVCARMTARLVNHCEQTGQGAVLCNDTGFLLEKGPDTLKGTDVAVILTGRWQGLSQDEWPEGAPDLVVEVASPGDSHGQLQRKVGQYLDAGARLVWVLYPGRKKAAVYDDQGLIQLLGEDQELTGDPVLPGFRCEIRDLLQ